MSKPRKPPGRTLDGLLDDALAGVFDFGRAPKKEPKLADLDAGLEAYGVVAVGQFHTGTHKDMRLGDITGLDGWFAVVSDCGVDAYFSTETAAFRWRLAEINRRLNA